MQLSRKVFMIGILLLTGYLGFAQIRPSFENPQNEDEYNVENVFGIVKATNSGLISALHYRHSFMIADNSLAHYGLELANTRHPREYRQTTFTGSTFVVGKSNFLISIRPYYGREKILFKKAPQQGVRVSGMLTGGPTLGLETPYFVSVRGGQTQQYNPEIPFGAIDGNAGPLRGLFESKVVPGAHLKASLTFETNSTKSRVFGIQAGFVVEGFTRKINILSETENKSVYSAGFIALYFGKRR